MSLAVAIPAALGAAVAYGTATAAQHGAAHDQGQGIDARRLVSLLGNPQWLAGIAGDGLGLVLQIIALVTGPVVLVQPILVLALPVSLPIGWLLGGPRPGWAQVRPSLAILLGLTGFFLLAGEPARGAEAGAASMIAACAAIAVAGALALVAGRHAPRSTRAALYGAVAGAWFGFAAVLMDDAASAWRAHGPGAFLHVHGAAALIGLVVIGGMGAVLTQVSFQLGALAASFPANLAADPVIAVVFGAVLLHETIRMGPLIVLGYLICLAVVLCGAIRLAAQPGTV